MDTEQAFDRLQHSLIEYAFNCGHSTTFPADLEALASLRQQLAEAQAKLADHEAMMAGAVEVECDLYMDYADCPNLSLPLDEYAALLPLDGQPVLVVRKPV